MEALRSTVPGSGVVHHFTTRAGLHLGVLVDPDERRTLLVYGSDDPDRPAHAVVLDPDEADQVAEVLRTRSLAERLAALERRLDQVVPEAR
ncbi:hypothetical protein ACFV4N_32370 [Actinosynnema sp. NPDC059797]